MTPAEEWGARMAIEILIFILICLLIAGAAIKWAYKRRR